jgi:hypothetical protein|tara:strand:+ start:626 stop:790 length:165 start_codon:yes stop_codon:yes gene_type:complete
MLKPSEWEVNKYTKILLQEENKYTKSIKGMFASIKRAIQLNRRTIREQPKRREE